MNENVRREFWRSIETAHAPGSYGVLDEAYTQPHRAYHTWDHIDALLEGLQRFRHLATRSDLVAIAIFWHDFVHLARGADGRPRIDSENVRDSANAFRRHTLLEGYEADAAYDLIMATADHANAKARTEYYPGFAEDLDFFVDLDLSPLATPWEEFAANTRKIRAESIGVEDAEFLASQIKMLEELARIERPLFRRAETREQWDAPARTNLARCIMGLRNERAPLDQRGARR